VKSIKAWLSVAPCSHLELYSLSATWKLVFTPQLYKPFRNILGHAITLMIPTSTPEIVVLLNVSRERQLHARIPVPIHALEVQVSNLMPLLCVFFSFLLSFQYSIFQIYASRFNQNKWRIIRVSNPSAECRVQLS
jgi:hypothetical protein